MKYELPYPHYEGDFARVIVTTRCGNKTRAMFYWNGGEPTFSSYGTNITDSVINWEYDTEVQK